MKKIGIITFHNSYNCGSMLESYAMQTIIKKCGGNPQIINFSNQEQRELYGSFYKNKSIKNIIKNLFIISAQTRIKYNNNKYEEFKNRNFNLTHSYQTMTELDDSNYSTIVAGSDQIWNITIDDADDAYFLPWVKKARKVAYSPSFGAKNIMRYSNNPEKYRRMINEFDALSIREYNGKRWIKDLCGKDVEVLLDPTLLLEKSDYELIEKKDFNEKEKYIFFYAPEFKRDICKFVEKISKKYNLKVVTWSTKSYYVKRVKSFGFKLADYEDPSMYLSLIKNAELVITTSYHGTIFSTIYRKKFITVKNGGMYGDDDRVITLLKQLDMENRLIPYTFKENYDYLEEVDYTNYDVVLPQLKEKSIKYIDMNIIN